MNWTVAVKLSLSLSLVLALVVLATAAAFVESKNLRTQVDHLYRRGAVIGENLGDLAELAERLRSRAFRHVAARTSADKMQMEELISEEEQRFLDGLEDLGESLPHGDTDRDLVADVIELYRELKARRDGEVFPASRADDRDRALAIMVAVNGPVFDNMMTKIDRLRAKQVERSAGLHRSVDTRLIEISETALVFAGVAVLLTMAIVAWLSTSISQRLRALSAVADSIAGGDFDRRAPHTSGSDEIATLANAFNAMVDQVQRRTHELGERAKEEARGKREISLAVSEYGQFLSSIAGGNLNSSIRIQGEGDLAKLGHDLGAMAEAVRSMILQIHETIGALTQTSAEILATTEQHAAGAAEVASSVTETAATVDEVHQSAQRAAEGARGVQKAQSRSLEATAEGRRAVDLTIAAMGEVDQQMAAIAQRILGLSEQAQAVGHIITSVNELAEQSNLLALNASIEAVRAGEDAKGFAVVAQEMRSLAEQSKQATVQVRSILGDIQKSTNAAVLVTEKGTKAVMGARNAAAEAGARLGDVTRTSTESAEAAAHILRATDQQAEGVGQITTAVHSINVASQETVAGTRQIEQAARQLSEISRKLRDLLARYRA